MDVHIAVSGDRQVGVRFEAFPDDCYADLKAEIEELTDELLGLVLGAVPVRTGKLRSEVRSRVYADAQHIKGEVTIAGPAADLAKAGALEYGAHRPTRVSAHTMRLDHAWAEAFAAPELVMVAAYTRTPDIEAVAFERGPLAAMQPQILAGLNAAVEAAVEKANAG